jgi:hypothetical protein
MIRSGDQAALTNLERFVTEPESVFVDPVRPEILLGGG